MEVSNYPKLYLYSYQTETAIFIATKHKKQLWQLSRFLQIFPSFQTFGLEYYKNEAKEKSKNLLGINLVKYSSEVLAHIKNRSYRNTNKCSK